MRTQSHGPLGEWAQESAHEWGMFLQRWHSSKKVEKHCCGDKVRALAEKKKNSYFAFIQ